MKHSTVSKLRTLLLFLIAAIATSVNANYYVVIAILVMVIISSAASSVRGSIENKE